jgi:hypothetical protein
MSLPSTYPCVHYIFEEFSPCYEVSCWVTYFHSTLKESSNVRLELVWVFLIKSEQEEVIERLKSAS